MSDYGYSYGYVAATPQQWSYDTGGGFDTVDATSNQFTYGDDGSVSETVTSTAEDLSGDVVQPDDSVADESGTLWDDLQSMLANEIAAIQNEPPPTLPRQGTTVPAKTQPPPSGSGAGSGAGSQPKQQPPQQQRPLLLTIENMLPGSSTDGGLNSFLGGSTGSILMLGGIALLGVYALSDRK